ncbi:MAG: hypothetical protein SF051_15220 [Elusimicrobiota bacterium]|nr:hypothetical protein [Elusimicrobiota bacterium]
MNCPSCGYDNAEDALSCNLCQLVLRKEKAAAPPPMPAPAPASAAPASADGRLPGEPARMDNAQAFADILLLALKQGTAERFDEAERLMARVFLEGDPLLARDLLGAAGDAWHKATRLERAAEALLMVKAAAAATVTGDFDKAATLAMGASPLVKETTAEAFRLQLLLLGVRGAAKRGGRKAAKTAPAGGEPAKLDSFEAWRDLLELATQTALSGDLAGCARLASRFFRELNLTDCENLMLSVGESWLKTAGLPPDAEAAARASVKAAAAAAGREDFAGAHAALVPALQLLPKDRVGPGMRVAVLALGLKAMMGAAAPAPVPSILPDAAPPPGAANKPRF